MLAIKTNISTNIAIILFTLFAAGGIFLVKQHYSGPNEIKVAKAVPVKISPTPKPSNTATPTPKPTIIIPTKPSLVALRIDAVDFSHARPNGIITDVVIKLFRENGELIEEKAPSPHVVEGQVGSGGFATFNVPLGNYKAEASGQNMQGTVAIKLATFDDPSFYTIYMGAKSIRISGRYFIDSNKNMSYDQGEQLLGDKKVSAVVDTEGRLYTAAETRTDSNGNYNMYSTINGKYSMQGETIPGYNSQPTLWAQLSGGESINYDVYTWPQ